MASREEAKDLCHGDAEEEDQLSSRSEDEHATETDRPGLPDPDTVLSEETLTSPKGRQYRILKTSEYDPYDDEKGEEHRP